MGKAINSILKKISWKTRKWNYKLKLLEIIIGDQFGSWGISIISVHSHFREYSLFKIMLRLPNQTTVRSLTLDDWDFLFLRNSLWKSYDSLSDRKLWNPNGLTRFERVKLSFLDSIFK
jgi:hypothetical protein